MSEDKRGRRSTRLSISIQVVISGVDAKGNRFNESARTLNVNKHGGMIATTHPLALGTEVLIENRALGAAAKARVVRMDEKESSEDLHNVALELLEAQNIWGIAFPPDDWSSELREETQPAPGGPRG
jgi:hypothetical protein